MYGFAIGGTCYACDNDRKTFIKRLDDEASLLIEGYSNMKLNKCKYPFAISGYNCENFWVKIMKEKIIWNKNTKKSWFQ